MKKLHFYILFSIFFWALTFGITLFIIQPLMIDSSFHAIMETWHFPWQAAASALLGVGIASQIFTNYALIRDVKYFEDVFLALGIVLTGAGILFIIMTWFLRLLGLDELCLSSGGTLMSVSLVAFINFLLIFLAALFGEAGYRATNLPDIRDGRPR